jgi:hypothetical protein
MKNLTLLLLVLIPLAAIAAGGGSSVGVGSAQLKVSCTDKTENTSVMVGRFPPEKGDTLVLERNQPAIHEEEAVTEGVNVMALLAQPFSLSTAHFELKVDTSQPQIMDGKTQFAGRIRNLQTQGSGLELQCEVYEPKN